MATVAPKKRQAEKFKVSEVESALIATKGLISLAGEKLGCNRETIRQYVLRHPELAAVRDEARARMIDTAEIALESAILAKQGWAVCFTLKTLGRDRGYVERVEQTGPEGGPIEVIVKHVSTAAAQKN